MFTIGYGLGNNKWIIAFHSLFDMAKKFGRFFWIKILGGDQNFGNDFIIVICQMITLMENSMVELVGLGRGSQNRLNDRCVAPN